MFLDLILGHLNPLTCSCFQSISESPKILYILEIGQAFKLDADWPTLQADVVASNDIGLIVDVVHSDTSFSGNSLCMCVVSCLS